MSTYSAIIHIPRLQGINRRFSTRKLPFYKSQTTALVIINYHFARHIDSV